MGIHKHKRVGYSGSDFGHSLKKSVVIRPDEYLRIYYCNKPYPKNTTKLLAVEEDFDPNLKIVPYQRTDVKLRAIRRIP